jgi:hypothetical protein
MTNRVAYAPHDFEKMCKQAERDHESKKLVVLIDRVKKYRSRRRREGTAICCGCPVARPYLKDSRRRLFDPAFETSPMNFVFLALPASLTTCLAVRFFDDSGALSDAWSFR